LGVKINYAQKHEISPYVKLGLNYEFFGDTDVTYDSKLYRSNMSGFGGDVALGFDSSFAKDWHLYAEMNYERYVNVTAYGLNAGIRYSW
jgi:outer membrane autotransporter protein